jgi:hypothetical protein
MPRILVDAGADLIELMDQDRTMDDTGGVRVTQGGDG